jgi:hypothetical protein
LKVDRVDRFVIRAPELIASATDWERLAEGERFGWNAPDDVRETDVTETGDDTPEWAR